MSNNIDQKVWTIEITNEKGCVFEEKIKAPSKESAYLTIMNKYPDAICGYVKDDNEPFCIDCEKTISNIMKNYGD